MIRSIALAAVLGLGATAVSAEEATLTAAQLFASTCGFCHQDGGRVAGRGPKLAGTDRPDEYLLNRIRLGKEGAMPAYGRAFSDVQLRALVTYIRSLKDDAR
jgi:mono/diheme cytochrome c family protein